MLQCNNTLAELQINEDPLWDHGLTFHQLGLIISAVFGLISVFIAFFLVFQHATRYLKPFEQKHIIRILLMIPIYSTVSFLSYLHYKHAVYYQVLRDCYEAFAIASFFTLMCHYIAPNLHEQKVFFRTMEPVNWFWGVFGLQKCTGGENKGPFRKPRSGLTWFNVRIPRLLLSMDRMGNGCVDMTVGCLDRRLPILLHSRPVHDSIRVGRNRGSILRTQLEPGFCAHLGDLF